MAEVEARVCHVTTRLPFTYGITTLTRAPHVVLRVGLRGVGAVGVGWASETLVPKWFTKDPSTSITDDIRGIVSVIEHARDAGRGLDGASPFDLWWQLNETQVAWGKAIGLPGLLTGLGTALVERAIIDAACRLGGMPFTRALRSGHLGFDPRRIHPELRAPVTVTQTTGSIAVRHTVGLSDLLEDREIAKSSGDALPESLEAVIHRYGVSHFKLKVTGDLAVDLPRLIRVVNVVRANDVDAWYTIDGNEGMTKAAEFEAWTSGLLDDPLLGPTFSERLVALEQPFHRAVALGPEVSAAIRARSGDLAVIVDESDDEVLAVRRAMDLGYAGGTYKGCKGVFRGLANAALIHQRGRSSRTVLTAEDLATLPPLTVPQDLVVAAEMGLSHIERNGHHYSGGLAPIDAIADKLALQAHPDAFVSDGRGRARLRITDGQIQLGSMLRAPFGFGPPLDIRGLESLSAEAALRGTDESCQS